MSLPRIAPLDKTKSVATKKLNSGKGETPLPKLKSGLQNRKSLYDRDEKTALKNVEAAKAARAAAKAAEYGGPSLGMGLAREAGLTTQSVCDNVPEGYEMTTLGTLIRLPGVGTAEKASAAEKIRQEKIRMRATQRKLVKLKSYKPKEGVIAKAKRLAKAEDSKEIWASLNVSSKASSVQALRDRLKETPNDAATLWALGRKYFYMGNKWEEASAMFEQAIQHGLEGSDREELWLLLGDAIYEQYWKKGGDDNGLLLRGRKADMKALQTNRHCSNTRLMLRVVESYVREGEYGDALDAAGRVLGMNPNQMTQALNPAAVELAQMMKPGSGNFAAGDDGKGGNSDVKHLINRSSLGRNETSSFKADNSCINAAGKNLNIDVRISALLTVASLHQELQNYPEAVAAYKQILLLEDKRNAEEVSTEMTEDEKKENDANKKNPYLNWHFSALLGRALQLRAGESNVVGEGYCIGAEAKRVKLDRKSSIKAFLESRRSLALLEQKTIEQKISASEGERYILEKKLRKGKRTKSLSQAAQNSLELEILSCVGQRERLEKELDESDGFLDLDGHPSQQRDLAEEWSKEPSTWMKLARVHNDARRFILATDAFTVAMRFGAESSFGFDEWAMIARNAKPCGEEKLMFAIKAAQNALTLNPDDWQMQCDIRRWQGRPPPPKPTRTILNPEDVKKLTPEQVVVECRARALPCEGDVSILRRQLVLRVGTEDQNEMKRWQEKKKKRDFLETSQRVSATAIQKIIRGRKARSLAKTKRIVRIGRNQRFVAQKLQARWRGGNGRVYFGQTWEKRKRKIEARLVKAATEADLLKLDPILMDAEKMDGFGVGITIAPCVFSYAKERLADLLRLPDEVSGITRGRRMRTKKPLKRLRLLAEDAPPSYDPKRSSGLSWYGKRGIVLPDDMEEDVGLKKKDDVVVSVVRDQQQQQQQQQQQWSESTSYALPEQTQYAQEQHYGGGSGEVNQQEWGYEQEETAPNADGQYWNEQEDWNANQQWGEQQQDWQYQEQQQQWAQPIENQYESYETQQQWSQSY